MGILNIITAVLSVILRLVGVYALVAKRRAAAEAKQKAKEEADAPKTQSELADYYKRK